MAAQNSTRETLTLGESDPSGHEVEEIYSDTELFCIYKAGGIVRYVLPSNYAQAKKLRMPYYEISALKSGIERLRHKEGISETDKLYAERELARGIAQLFEERKADNAKVALTEVQLWLEDILRNKFRKKYITSNIFTLIALAVVFGTIIGFYPFTLPEEFMPIKTDVAAAYSAYCLFGALGSFMSVLLGIRNINLEADLDTWDHYFAGASRIMIGVIGAVVLALALDSHFLSPGFSTNTPTPQGYYFLSIIAGFSETFVPNILRKGESSTHTNKQGE